MRLNILIRIFFFAFLVPLLAHAGDAPDFVVYIAQSHTAEELQAAAQGVMSGGRVSILDNKVVIYGTTSQRNAILKLFAELDHPLQNYMVSVRTVSHGTHTRDASAVDAAVNAGPLKGRANGGGVANGARAGSVTIAGPAGAVRGSAVSNDSDGANSGEQQIMVSDGGSGRLYADSGVFPRTVNVYVRSVGHVGAHVEIRESDPGAVGEQALVTDITLPLGEWRTIGGTALVTTGHSGSMFGKTKISNMSSADIQVKVDVELPAGK